MPAASVGLKAGDTVIAVDGEPVRFWRMTRRIHAKKAECAVEGEA
jgi:membrane-associated protease RseP (regulator of RpoE activity)